MFSVIDERMCLNARMWKILQEQVQVDANLQEQLIVHLHFSQLKYS